MLYQTEAQTQGGKLEPIQPPSETLRGFGGQPWRLFQHIVIPSKLCSATHYSRRRFEPADSHSAYLEMEQKHLKTP